MSALQISLKASIVDYWLNRDDLSEDEKKHKTQLLCEKIIQLCRERFEETENTIYVWIALGYIRKDAPLPEWIFDYISKSARNLGKIEDPKDFNTKIKDVLNIDGNSYRKHLKDIEKDKVRMDVDLFTFSNKAKTVDEAMVLIENIRQKQPVEREPNKYEAIKKAYYNPDGLKSRKK